MRKVINLFLLATILLTFVSCNKKQHAIDNLSEFVAKVENHASEYTEEDWTKANLEYDELITEIDKYEYSSDESKRISELKGKFSGIKAKNTVNKLIEGIDKAAKEVKGTIEGFTKGILGSEEKEPEQ